MNVILKRVGESPKSVITDVVQIACCLLSVVEVQPSLLKAVDLLFNRERSF